MQTSSNPRALLIDMDDTILVDNDISIRVWKSACEKYAPELGGIDSNTLYNAIQKASHLYWSDPGNHRLGRLDLKAARSRVVKKAIEDLGFPNSPIADRMAETFTLEKEKAIMPFPGALEALSAFKERGLRMALITNGASETQRRKIQRFSLETYFESVLIEAEFGVGKPDERIFKAALSKLNVGADEAWMIGDDLGRDIVGAKKLGIFSIWVDITGNGLPANAIIQPDRIIQGLSELVNHSSIT